MGLHAVEILPMQSKKRNFKDLRRKWMVLILTMRNLKLILWWWVHFAIITFSYKGFSSSSPGRVCLCQLPFELIAKMFSIVTAPSNPWISILPPLLISKSLNSLFLLLTVSFFSPHPIILWIVEQPRTQTPTFPFMSSSPRPHQLYNTLFFHESSFSYAPQWDWVGDNHIFKQLFVQLPHAGPI